MTYLMLKKKLEELIAVKNNTSSLVKGNEEEIKNSLLECRNEMAEAKRLANEKEEFESRKVTLEESYIAIHKNESEVFMNEGRKLSEYDQAMQIAIYSKKMAEVGSELREVHLKLRELDEIFRTEKIQEKLELTSLWKEVKFLYEIDDKNLINDSVDEMSKVEITKDNEINDIQQAETSASKVLMELAKMTENSKVNLTDEKKVGIRRIFGKKAV